MTEEADALARIALLEELSRDERVSLAQRCTWRRYRKNQVVLSPDDADRDLLMCVDGEIDVTSYSLSGRQVNFARLGPGCHFGELSAIDGGMRSASAVAVRQAEIARLPHGAFEELLSAHPGVARRLLEGLAGMIRRLNERVIDLNTLSANRRVVRELLRAARPSPVSEGQWIIEPAPTQATLAARADTTRETTARVLSELRDGGLIATRGGCLTLRDKENLESLLDHLE